MTTGRINQVSTFTTAWQYYEIKRLKERGREDAPFQVHPPPIHSLSLSLYLLSPAGRPQSGPVMFKRTKVHFDIYQRQRLHHNNDDAAFAYGRRPCSWCFTLTQNKTRQGSRLSIATSSHFSKRAISWFLTRSSISNERRVIPWSCPLKHARVQVKPRERNLFLSWTNNKPPS
jgi:hypothetical protein